MKYKRLKKLPCAYSIETRADGLVNVYLCREVCCYYTDSGREYDVDVRAVWGVEATRELEADIQARWDDWWRASAAPIG